MAVEDRWVSTPKPVRRFHALSVGLSCRVGRIASADCITVEDRDERIHLRTVTTYARGIGPIRYVNFQYSEDRGSKTKSAQTVELVSYHVSAQ